MQRSRDIYGERDQERRITKIEVVLFGPTGNNGLRSLTIQNAERIGSLESAASNAVAKTETYTRLLRYAFLGGLFLVGAFGSEPIAKMIQAGLKLSQAGGAI